MQYLLESVKLMDRDAIRLIPKYDFVYAFLDVADFHNWQSGQNTDPVTFVEDTDFKLEHLHLCCIPIGGVEFCLKWYHELGCAPIHPLNIPTS